MGLLYEIAKQIWASQNRKSTDAATARQETNLPDRKRKPMVLLKGSTGKRN